MHGAIQDRILRGMTKNVKVLTTASPPPPNANFLCLMIILELKQRMECSLKTVSDDEI